MPLTHPRISLARLLLVTLGACLASPSPAQPPAQLPDADAGHPASVTTLRPLAAHQTGAMPQTTAPPALPPFALAAWPAPITGAGPTIDPAGLAPCAALDLRTPRWSGVHGSPEPDGAVTQVAIELGHGLTHHLDLSRQDEYNIGPAEPLDANADGIADLLLYFADRHGSGRERYAALLLGCGDGAYAYRGTMTLGAAAAHGHPDLVPGGFLVTLQRAVAADDPTLTTTWFQGYRLAPIDWSLVPTVAQTDRAAVLTALSRPGPVAPPATR